MIADFVLETANAPGSALQVLLAGPSPGRRSWSQAFSSGAPVYYFMDDGSQSEWGNGTFTAGNPNTISRTTVIWNTSGNTSRLNFTGATNVYSEIPAERMLYVDAIGYVRSPPGGFIIDPILGAVPVGASMDYWGPAAPAGWLFCNGIEVSRTTYARLYAALGGAGWAFQGNGSTTFGLPDCRGRVTAGRDAMGTGNVARLSGVFGAGSDLTGGSGGDQYTQFHGHPMHILDPTHAHGIYDPTHAHGIYDPGHVHAYRHRDFSQGAGYQTGVGVVPVDSWLETDDGALRGTGISINGSSTGIGIYAAATGLYGNGQNATGSFSYVENYGVGTSQNIQPTIMCNKIIYAGA